VDVMKKLLLLLFILLIAGCTFIKAPKALDDATADRPVVFTYVWDF